MTKGSERADPPVPRSHRWAVECRDPGVQIDVQIDLLVARLRPHLDGLRRIAAVSEVSVGLLMVRYFHSPDGQNDIEGWCLGPDVLEFLASVSASVGSDEYDLTPD